MNDQVADERSIFLRAIEITSAEGRSSYLDAACGDNRRLRDDADLRSVGPLLAREEGGLLAYARGLMHWHQRHRFCGVCGSPTESREAGHMRRCTNPACAAEHLPAPTRRSSCGSMTVAASCWGARSRWPVGMHSVLAGFVEPGESLEDAVRREVGRGGRASPSTEVNYHSSSPGPFPPRSCWASPPCRGTTSSGSMS